jgi:HK97 gp10 family phage protein
MIISGMSMSGYESINRNLELLTRGVRDKHLKRAMKAAVDPITSVAKARVRRKTGVMEMSIDSKISSKGSRGENVKAYIGPRTGIRVPIGKDKGLGTGKTDIPTRRAHLLEFGHNIVKNGKVVGRVPPKPFMRPAWDVAGGTVALNRFSDALTAGLDAEVSKLPTSP